MQHGGMTPTPDHYSIKCSDVDAKRNKDGTLPKNYQYSYLNQVLAVGNRFLSIHKDSSDEVILSAPADVKKKEDPVIHDAGPDTQKNEAPAKEEDLF